MPFKHGRLAEVWAGAADISGYFRGADVSADVDTAETTTFKKTWKTFIPGEASSKVTLDGLYDPTFTNLESLLAGVTAGTVLTVSPAGAVAIGDRSRLVSVFSTNYTTSSPVGDVVAAKWAVLADGVVGYGYALHILSVDTGTTTGATRDDTTASATGWQAHLHVTAVSSGTWTVKLQDASASNFSDGADVTGGSFTATTIPTSQRLVAASSTTALRRYVRYVATVVGGSTPTITFALALARNS